MITSEHQIYYAWKDLRKGIILLLIGEAMIVILLFVCVFLLISGPVCHITI